MKWKCGSRSESRQVETIHGQLVFRDFLKMLGAAILCGLAVSITVAGVTLLLTGSAEARRLQHESTLQTAARSSEFDEVAVDDVAATPGALLLGDGCDNTMLSAFERDWQVRIDRGSVEVRVMQAYQLPEDATEIVVFHLQLIKGARMQSFAAQTAIREWGSHLITAEAYERLTPAEYLKLAGKEILVSQTPRGTVMTSPIIGLKSGELLTIAYTYVINLDTANGMSSFILPLEAEDEHAVNSSPSFKNGGAIQSSAFRAGPATRGAVWVTWTGSRPSHVLGLPDDADLELAKSGVAGFSWAATDIPPGAHLHLAWAS